MLLALSEARQRRTKHELELQGAMAATAHHKPKAIQKVIRPGARHGGRQRLGKVWWGNQGDS
jgi:hypothetical protein